MTTDIAPTRLGPARRRVLGDEVADAIRHAIVSGDLKPGARLVEDELATQLNVSRGPVREALVRPVQEGLVVNERHRGATVSQLVASEVEEIYSLRKALERLAVVWFCRNARDEDLQGLCAILAKVDSMPKPLEKLAIANLDMEFHDAVFRGSGHARLCRAWEGLRSQILLFLLQGGALPSDFDISWRSDHEEFLKVLRTRKPAAAQKQVDRHIEGTYQRVVHSGLIER